MLQFPRDMGRDMDRARGRPRDSERERERMREHETDLLVAEDGETLLEGELEPVAARDPVAGPVVEVLVRDHRLHRLEVRVGGWTVNFVSGCATQHRPRTRAQSSSRITAAQRSEYNSIHSDNLNHMNRGCRTVVQGRGQVLDFTSEQGVRRRAHRSTASPARRPC
jgi:hypothetical protein